MSRLVTSAMSFSETENGALTYNTTGNQVLDLFSMGGALRKADRSRICHMVEKAYAFNPKQTIATLLYLRDIRGGQGEKRLFREAVNELLMKHRNDIDKNALFDAIVEVGSWKDVFDAFTVDEYAPYVVAHAKEASAKGTSDLLFKWAPSIGGSKNKDAEKLASYFGMSPKAYRKMLSAEREKLRIVESKMCANEWEKIDYEHLPSRAGFLHGPAFRKHDTERYNAYIAAAKKADGSVKMNTGTLYPYEIVKPFMEAAERWYGSSTVPNKDQLEATWKNLPNYCDGSNSLVVADTSGSMYGTPMAIACSLAIYFAERNTGIFHNEWVTFSRTPKFWKFKDGDTLEHRVTTMVQLNICENTDLQATFNLILKAAVDNSIPEEEMPKNIYVISDMEFDMATSQGYGRQTKTNFEEIKRKYAEAGYAMPQLIFWNVDSRQDNVPVKLNEKGVALVSGASASTFQMALTGELDPVKFMLQTIDKPRYSVPAERILKM